MCISSSVYSPLKHIGIPAAGLVVYAAAVISPAVSTGDISALTAFHHQDQRAVSPAFFKQSHAGLADIIVQAKMIYAMGGNIFNCNMYNSTVSIPAISDICVLRYIAINRSKTENTVDDMARFRIMCCPFGTNITQAASNAIARCNSMEISTLHPSGDKNSQEKPLHPWCFTAIITSKIFSAKNMANAANKRLEILSF